MDLQKIINDIDKRLKALEHTVNEVIIDGLKRANDSYIDDERYKVFSDTYGEMIAPYADSMKSCAARTTTSAVTCTTMTRSRRATAQTDTTKTA